MLKGRPSNLWKPKTVRSQNLTWKNVDIQAQKCEIFASDRNIREDSKRALSSANI